MNTTYSRIGDVLAIENARIFFRNFSGNPDKYHKNGGFRSFCVGIDDSDVAQQLLDEGWNVQIRAPRDEGEEARYHIQVSVKFDGPFPPAISVKSYGNTNRLDEDSVGELDTAELRNVCLAIRPYMWDVNGKTGIKAYLKRLRAEVEEDIFPDDEYSE